MTRRNGMFIEDAEIRERFPDKADAIIAALEELGTTKKNKATRPEGARYRPAVDVWLEANEYGEPPLLKLSTHRERVIHG